MTYQEYTNEVIELAQDQNFINACAETAKKIGMSVKEWNDNKVNILVLWANEVISKK